MGLGSLFPEFCVSVSHFMFVWSSWFAARLFYVPISGCKDGIFGCTYVEPISPLVAFGASVLYFYIARHVLNFLYKGKLPDGDNMEGMVKKFLGNATKMQNGKRR